MQQKSYPLPPLFLSEVIEKCAQDHQCHFDPDEPEYSCQPGCDQHTNMTPEVVSIEEGHGRHVCDRSCPDEMRLFHTSRCMRHCEDSDWVVTLRYNRRNYWATYGVKRAGDVQDVSLWMD